MSKYTDRTDVNISISLYEQGCIRDPKTDKTIMMKLNRNGRLVAISSYISAEDVRDALEEQETGFFSYIGEEDSKEDVICNVDNSNLSHLISSLNSYNGWFITIHV